MLFVQFDKWGHNVSIFCSFKVNCMLIYINLISQWHISFMYQIDKVTVLVFLSIRWMNHKLTLLKSVNSIHDLFIILNHLHYINVRFEQNIVPQKVVYLFIIPFHKVCTVHLLNCTDTSYEYPVRTKSHTPK